MREQELKCILDDMARRQALVEGAGARLTFAGHMADCRFDDASRSLGARDLMLRLRVYTAPDGTRATLDWKGPTRHERGYKVRDEVSTPVGDASAMTMILEQAGFRVATEIDREIHQYDLDGTTIRFERYPRLYDLVEVEGTTEGIDRAIAALDLPREAFTSERLGDFVTRFQAEHGVPAVICRRGLEQPDLCGSA